MWPPALDTAISDGSQIVVEHGSPADPDHRRPDTEVWTTATTVEEALAELGQDPGAYQLSADRAREIPLDGLAVTAETLFSATLSPTVPRRPRRSPQPPPTPSATC